MKTLERFQRHTDHDSQIEFFVHLCQQCWAAFQLQPLHSSLRQLFKPARLNSVRNMVRMVLLHFVHAIIWFIPFIFNVTTFRNEG